jgi:hypothetical protein
MARGREFPDAEVDSWLEREIASCRFDDVRHGKRLGILLEQLSERIGGSIPFACQDWAATKAAYRFFSNARIREDKILAGHFLCTKERFASARGGPVLVLHDTSEFVYRSEENEAIGMVSKQRTRSRGRPRNHRMRNVLMHSSLVVTQQGLPLGLAAITFWTTRHHLPRPTVNTAATLSASRKVVQGFGVKIRSAAGSEAQPVSHPQTSSVPLPF